MGGEGGGVLGVGGGCGFVVGSKGNKEQGEHKVEFMVKESHTKGLSSGKSSLTFISLGVKAVWPFQVWEQ